MKPPVKFEKIINRKRYSVETSALLAGNDHWDGHNFERSGRNTFLYRTQNGGYFTVLLTQWQGEQDTIAPVSLDEALELFENSLTEHRVPYETAFPGVTVQDA